MLDEADAMVVERDPRLPGLAIMLDPEAMAAALRRVWPDSDILSVRPQYLRYKPGTSCLAAYEVGHPAGTVRMYARCHRDDLAFKVEEIRFQKVVAGELGPGLTKDSEAEIAVFAFPNDYEIRTLKKLYDGERARPRLRRIVPGHPHLHGARAEVLRYKPERRFVGRLAAEGGPDAVIRVYPQESFARVREKAWTFRSQGPLRVPRAVGDSTRYCVVASEWIEGVPLTGVIESGGEACEWTERVATAALTLHRQRPVLQEMYAAEDYLRMVMAAGQAVEALDPELGRRAASLHAELRSAVRSHDWRSRPVHGDFTPEQVLLCGEQTAVLDFDRAGYGEPCMDLGAFAAGMHVLAIEGRLTAARAEALAAEFCAAYWRRADGEKPAASGLFTAGALLMLAPRPFRCRQPNWLARTTAILDVAERTLLGAAAHA